MPFDVVVDYLKRPTYAQNLAPQGAKCTFLGTTAGHPRNTFRLRELRHIEIKSGMKRHEFTRVHIYSPGGDYLEVLRVDFIFSHGTEKKTSLVERETSYFFLR